MTVLVLTVLLGSAFVGLAAGRWQAVVAPLAAVPPCAVLGGAEAAALALLATAGLAAGVHLHRAVADNTVPRAG
jgi:hypothetical protein